MIEVVYTPVTVETPDVPTLDPLFHINLREGQFNRTTAEDVQKLFANLATTGRDRMVVHFHGGLVDYFDGLKNAHDLQSPYWDSGAYPVFFLWESGPLDVLPAVLKRILGEGIFRAIFDRVAQFAQAKLTPQGAGFEASIQPLDPVLRAKKIPDLKRSALESSPITPLTQAEKELILQRLRQDAELNAIIQAERAKLPRPESLESNQLPTLMDRMYLLPPSRSLEAFNPWDIFVAILEVVVQVVRRFLDRTDHGLHATISEEIARKLYLGVIGGLGWQEMKNYTHQAFANETSGGSVFLGHLVEALKTNPRLQVTLVGHSAGTIYVSEFLKAAQQRLPERQFDVVFMAAAISYTTLAQTIAASHSSIARIRLFAMEDALERADALLQGAFDGQFGTSLNWLYPHSLLYLISGLLENNPDTPLVGMQRFHTGYSGNIPLEHKQAIQEVQQYLSTPSQMVWAKTPPGTADGWACDSTGHGGFPQYPLTLQSLTYITKNGLN